MEFKPAAIQQALPGRVGPTRARGRRLAATPPPAWQDGRSKQKPKADCVKNLISHGLSVPGFTDRCRFAMIGLWFPPAVVTNAFDHKLSAFARPFRRSTIKLTC